MSVSVIEQVKQAMDEVKYGEVKIIIKNGETIRIDTIKSQEIKKK